MCLILTEKKGRTSLCCELGGGWRDPGVEAAALCSCLVQRNPLGSSREKFHFLACIWVGLGELTAVVRVRAGEMLLAHPHVAQSLHRSSAGSPAWERLAQTFFPLFPLALGLEEAGKGSCSPELGGMCVPRAGIPGTAAILDPFFPVIWGCAAGLTGSSSFCLSFPGPTLSPFLQ